MKMSESSKYKHLRKLTLINSSSVQVSLNHFNCQNSTLVLDKYQNKRVMTKTYQRQKVVCLNLQNQIATLMTTFKSNINN